MIATGSSTSSSCESAAWSEQPCPPQLAVNSSDIGLADSSHSATRSTGWRQSVDSSAPRAATISPTTVGSTAAACCQPIRSTHSNGERPLSYGREQIIGEYTWRDTGRELREQGA